MGKLFIFIGLLIVIVGLILEFMPNVPLGRLPGDIRIERENFTFYFPITSCILLSLTLMFALFLWKKLKG